MRFDSSNAQPSVRIFREHTADKVSQEGVRNFRWNDNLTAADVVKESVKKLKLKYLKIQKIIQLTYRYMLSP